MGPISIGCWWRCGVNSRHELRNNCWLSRIVKNLTLRYALRRKMRTRDFAQNCTSRAWFRISETFNFKFDERLLTHIHLFMDGHEIKNTCKNNKICEFNNIYYNISTSIWYNLNISQNRAYTKFILAPRAARLQQKELRASSWRNLKTLMKRFNFHTVLKK